LKATLYSHSALNCGLSWDALCLNLFSCMWILLIVDCIRGNQLDDALACEPYYVTVSLMIVCYHGNETHGLRMELCAVVAEEKLRASWRGNLRGHTHTQCLASHIRRKHGCLPTELRSVTFHKNLVLIYELILFSCYLNIL
jgi:hypothetical protein